MPDTDRSAAQAAYEQLLPAIRAIPAEKVKKPRVEMALAAGIVLAALPRIESHKDALLALPLTDKTLLAELGLRARAMVYAWGELKTAPSAERALPSLVAEGDHVRQTLLAAAELLVLIGPVKREQIDAIRADSGHADLGRDLVVLHSLFLRPNIAELPAAQAVRSYVADAGRLGDAILIAVGERARPSNEEPEEIQLRDRAFTLFSEAYDNVRHGLGYLRGREGDVDSILPNIYALGRRARGESEGEPVDGGGGVAGGGVAPAPFRAVDGGENDGTEPGGPFEGSR